MPVRHRTRERERERENHPETPPVADKRTPAAHPNADSTMAAEAPPPYAAADAPPPYADWVAAPDDAPPPYAELVLGGERRCTDALPVWFNLGLLRAVGTTAPRPLLQPPEWITCVHDPRLYLTRVLHHGANQLFPPHSLVFAQLTRRAGERGPPLVVPMQIDEAAMRVAVQGERAWYRVTYTSPCANPADETRTLLVTADRRRVLGAGGQPPRWITTVTNVLCTDYYNSVVERMIVVAPDRRDPSARAQSEPVATLRQLQALPQRIENAFPGSIEGRG